MYMFGDYHILVGFVFNLVPVLEWKDIFSVFFEFEFDNRLCDFGRIVKIGNKNYPLQPLIGCPFGSVFQVENGIKGPCLSRVTSTTEGFFLSLCLYFLYLNFYAS